MKREFWLYETGFGAGENYSEYHVTSEEPTKNLTEHVHVREVDSTEPDYKEIALELATVMKYYCNQPPKVVEILSKYWTMLEGK